MAGIIVEATNEGVRLSPEELERAGVEPGRWVEVVPLPSRDEIAQLALGFVVRKLGDAIAVGPPSWKAHEWSVPLWSHDGEERLGELILNARGEVLVERSATYESVRADVPAKSPAHPPA